MGYPFRPIWITITTLFVVFIIASEFFLDISQAPSWSFAVLAADIAVIILYSVSFLVDGLRSKYGLLSWIKDRQLDTLFMVSCWLFTMSSTRAAAALVISRLILTAISWVVRHSSDQGASIMERARPSHILGLSFLLLIGFGSVLLMFPAATVDGRGLGFTDAIFTITSAACVTGLVVVSTGEHFTFFGQLVILFCIQIGGIEIMVLSAAFLSKIGGFLPSRQTASIGSLVHVTSATGVTRLITSVTSTTIVVEVLGVISLWFLWSIDVLPLPAAYDNLADALWWSIFHTINAFCQAGFSLAPDSLSAFVGIIPVNLVFIIIISIAGLGFLTVWELGQLKWEQLKEPVRTWSKLQFQTRLILAGSLALNLLGILLFIFFEYNQSLRGLELIDKVSASTFQVVTMRSTGFNTLPIDQLTMPASILTCIWMIIGCAPGSTGGGIRITTAVLVILSVRAMLLGRNDAEIYGRTIRQNTMYRAMSIVLITIALLAVSTMALTSTHDFPLEQSVFEITSALTTVGLSMGVTPDLNTFGRWLIITLMFLGRVGPLILALRLGEQKRAPRYQYPDGDISVS
jgi:trk system potassium uptake protein